MVMAVSLGVIHAMRHLEHPPRDGHDDGLAGDDLAAVQTAPVRDGERLDAAHPRAGEGIYDLGGLINPAESPIRLTFLRPLAWESPSSLQSALQPALSLFSQPA